MTRQLLPILALLWLLSACSLTQTTEQQPNIIIAPNETQAAFELSLTQLALLPTPTATLAPDALLQSADRKLLNGYYEAAVDQYQLVLAQGEYAPADERATAALGLGRSALREGLFEEAANALTIFVDQFPQDSRVAQAYFLRGDAFLGLSRWDNAIADFNVYLASRPGLIDSYAYERIGDAQLALGQFDQAVGSYQASASADRGLVPQLILREKLAQLYISAGQPANAVAQYDAILSVARNAPYRASIAYAAAQALLDGGDFTSGLARMQEIFEQYSDRPEAYQAMQALLQNGITVDPFQRGQVSYAYGDYTDAIEAYNTYSTQHPLTDIPPQMFMQLGRAYREVGNPAAAITAFQSVIDQYPTSTSFGDALLEQGRTYFLSGDIPTAIDQYMRIADTYDYLPQAAEALWRAGYLYGTNDEPELAATIFEQLADRYPDTEQARDGLLLAANASMQTGNLGAAERFYAALASTATGDLQAEAYLNVGRLALQRGDAGIANQALQQAAQAAPDSYFSARARDIRDSRAPFARPTTYQFQFDDAADVAQAESWLRQMFGIEQEGSLWQLSPALQADARLIRGTELWGVAAYDEARAEFDDLLNTTEDDALASYQLAIYWRQIGAYQASIQAAANIIDAANISTLEAPPYIARMRYPVYYLDVVQTEADKYDIDPLLLFALIRHESLFDANATAAAGEKGLTQVIPSTGEYIAQQLDWPGYQHSVLFRPYASVAFGAYYLHEQLMRFDNNVPASLGAYNAGPGNAAQWLALSGGDPDLFISSITISSTRTYVTRIYGYHAIYRALYGGQGQ
ncbi:MAG: tetratricopeptide repeat protein [Anaerolineae bacterium]|nr:tetratricopeptide repeat protein [Anaerolineae bacterium]